MFRNALLLASVMLLASAPAFAVSIDFDDGTLGASVGAQYSAQGVTFSNADFSTNFGLPGSSGALGIRATDNGGLGNSFAWLEANAVSASFVPDVFMVSIVGIDVGGNGITIKAYDSFVGGALLDSETIFGTGAGVGEFYTVTSNSAAIKRVEIFQETTQFTDGIVLDDLMFSQEVPVPEPGAAMLFAAGLLVVRSATRRRLS
jgi:hypothetical protein